MVDLVLKCFAAVAVALALVSAVPADQVALMLVVAGGWIYHMNVWHGAPVY